MLRSSILVLLLTAPALAGCFASDPEPVVAGSVAASAQEAGAIAGPAPAAATDPYQLAADEGAAAVTVYPVPIQTNAAKAPYTNEFRGEFEPYECAPTGGGVPLGGLGLVGGGHVFDVVDAFAKGDVFSYAVTLTFTNSDSSWGDLHLWHNFDGVQGYWNEPTSQGRGDVVLNFTGQGFIVNEEFYAGIGVDCWYGQATQPIPYVVRVDVTFAQGAVPAEVPVLLRVPEGATRLFATALPLGDAPVQSHFRVFAPDDSLVCECALGGGQAASVLELATPGDHVILVDHTSDGFVAFAMDAPPVMELLPLGSTYLQVPLGGGDGGPVDEALVVDVPSTPLNLWTWVFAPGEIAGAPDAGYGHNVLVEVTNARGTVSRTKMVGYATFHAAVPETFVTNEWYAVPLDGDWEFLQDHHAYDLGPHNVVVKADQMRGQAMMFAQLYERPDA